MTTPALHVDLDTLHHHTGRLRRLENDLAEAAGAARHADLHDGAFGLLCGFLPAVVGGALEAAASALDDATRSVDEAADGVRAMARAWDATDRAAVDRLRHLTGRLA